MFVLDFLITWKHSVSYPCLKITLVTFAECLLYAKNCAKSFKCIISIVKTQVGPLTLNLLLREQARGSKETCPTSISVSDDIRMVNFGPSYPKLGLPYCLLEIVFPISICSLLKPNYQFNLVKLFSFF